jgi:hypothetical protein
MDLSIGDTRLIIEACKARGALRNQAAYVLATAYHESAHLIRPIYERGARDYFNKYEPGTRIGEMLGNDHAGDGYLYRGRGYVQLTGRANYAKAGAKLGLDLIRLPDLALVPANAAQILVVGMLDGWFTGKSLSSYITLSSSDFVNARRIINGMDRADLIAGYAKEYDALLKAEGYEADPQPAQPASPAPVPAPAAPSAPVKAPAAPAPSKPVAKHVGLGIGAFAIGAALARWWGDILAWIHHFL